MCPWFLNRKNRIKVLYHVKTTTKPKSYIDKVVYVPLVSESKNPYTSLSFKLQQNPEVTFEINDRSRISSFFLVSAMETEVTQVEAAKKKEPIKRAAAKKKTTAKSTQISDDNSDGDEDFEIKEIAAPPAAKKGGGRKAAANAKTTKPPAAAAAANKREPKAKLGQKLITQMLEPTENSGISPEKKVRRIRASPFNKKSGSILGRVGIEVVEEEEDGGNEGKMMGSGSSATTEESAGYPPARGKSQRANRTQVRYVVSDSDSEPVAEESEFDDDEDSDFDEE